MKGLITLLAVCTFTAAMVPMRRRAVNTDEEELLGVQTTTVTPKDKVECEPQTPCAWSTYKTVSDGKVIDMNITNSYCLCKVGTQCLISEDDSTAKAFIYRCSEQQEGVV